MDIIIPIFFFVFGFICFIFALFEERETNDVDDAEESKSDNLIIMLLASGTVLFFIAMACMLSITTSYYSSTTDTMITLHMKEYEPLAYAPLGFAMLGIILTAYKAFQMLDRARNQEE
jgi:heme/copper-type cytochrome/quinol oxidase subunit 2